MHFRHFGAERSRAISSHGAKPHTPSFYESGERWEERHLHSHHLSAERSRAMGSHGAKPHTPSFYEGGERWEERHLHSRHFSAERSRAMGSHGAKPHTPLSLKAARGEKKGVCIPSIWVHGSGRHSMCKHACSDKLASSGACGFNSLHRSPIRVCPLQERACTFWQTGFQRRGQFSQPLPLYHSGVERAMGSHGARPAVSQFYKGRASPFKHDRAPAPYDFNGRLFRSH